MNADEARALGRDWAITGEANREIFEVARDRSLWPPFLDGVGDVKRLRARTMLKVYSFGSGAGLTPRQLAAQCRKCKGVGFTNFIHDEWIACEACAPEDPVERGEWLLGKVRAFQEQFSYTVSGRTSCSSPAVQNIPLRTELGREVREALVLGQGDLVQGEPPDYQTLELRTLSTLREWNRKK